MTVLHPTERDFRLYGETAIWFAEIVTAPTAGPPPIVRRPHSGLYLRGRT